MFDVCINKGVLKIVFTVVCYLFNRFIEPKVEYDISDLPSDISLANSSTPPVGLNSTK